MGPLPGHSCDKQEEAYCVTWIIEGYSPMISCTATLADCVKSKARMRDWIAPRTAEFSRCDPYR